MSNYAFNDSGAPASTPNYTTLVILHGCAFSKDAFQKLLPLATQYQMRVVLLNHRDYPGSKPLTDEELRQYDGPDGQGHEQYFSASAQELADFLLDFAIKERLPKAKADSAGGIAVMGWFAGNAYTLALLSHATAIVDSTREQLEPFLRSLVIFDAPGHIVGRPLVRNAKFDLLDAAYTVEERFRMFAEWVSTYYEHPSVTSHNIDDLHFALDPKAQRCPHSSTTSRLSEDEYRALVWPEAAMRTDVPGMVYPYEEFAQWTRRALFNEDLARKYWPSLKVDVIWCEHTVGTCVEAGWVYEELKKEHVSKGVKGRPLKITMMPGANHFPHWDQPDKAMAFFAKTVDAA